MFFIKYSLINILRNKKLFIPMFFIFILSLLMIIYVFGINKSVSESYEKNNFNTAAITTKSEYFNNLQTLNLTISNDLAESFVLPEYVYDFYILEELRASSNNTKPVPNNISVYEDVPICFRLASYSNIDKSVDFMTGKREIAEGRYAVRANECNISADLAELNGFTVGNNISLNLWGYDSNDNNINLTIVGIFSDSTKEVGSELDSIMSVRDVSGSAEASIGADRRNDILTVAETLNNIDTIVFKTVLYYIHDENSLIAFKQEIGKILPAPFMILDNLGAIQFIRQIIDGTKSSYMMLLGFVGVICSMFYGLFIFNSLKSRTYDIGVLRSRGLPRMNTALLFACEVFITSSLAFIVASVLYYATFAPVTDFLYGLQRNHINNVMWNQGGVSVEIANTVIAYKMNVSFSVLELMSSFLVSIIFAVVIGIVGAAYVARNEPIKTMVEY